MPCVLLCLMVIYCVCVHHALVCHAISVDCFLSSIEAFTIQCTSTINVV